MKISRPRYGSLQFWPRKRAERFLPSVNWSALKGDGLLGFIAYKAGMATATVKDSTPKSMTPGKKLSIPVTFLETPPVKIYSVRFYKDGKVKSEVVVSNDRELKRIIKVMKTLPAQTSLDEVKDFDDIRVIIYSIPKEAKLKKTPDIIEVGIGAKDKLSFVKSHIGKNILFTDVFKGDLVDVRGLTKGKGLSGPVARFGISLRQHKSEKGRRGPGSLGPWHPARVIFRVPLSGQLGMFTRVHNNLKILGSKATLKGKISELRPFKNYGLIRTDYLVLHGSVQGPAKRQVLLTSPLRPTLKQVRKKLELLEVHG
ncbi:50S ribosomal protein L3 [Candidatus Pacearchaeota archaeon]|nr:50S ribosomal protein L3 [Candidatus Pacearchaeota archaeon]